MTSKSIRNILVPVGAAFCIFPLFASAQVKADDVVGIRTGMTVEEVKAAIKKHDPALKIKEYRNAIVANYPGGGGVFQLIAETCGSGINICSERIYVEFTRFGEKAVTVDHDVLKPNLGLASEVANAIQQKYGEPSERSDLAMLWSYDTNNKLLKTGVGCKEVKVTPEEAKLGAIPCGIRIIAQVAGIPGQATNQYKVEMRNWKLSVEDSDQLAQARQANEDKLNRSLQGSRPKL